MAKIWFRNKRYGVGYSPASWQGWLATIVAVALVTLDTVFTPTLFQDRMAGQLAAFGVACLLLGAFIMLCAARSDGPMRWRWGKRD